jgi:hypothetical protein
MVLKGRSRQCRRIMENLQQSAREQRPPWSVVVVFEDEETRKEAVAFCDGLVAKFWSTSGFEFGWWLVKDLTEPEAWEQSLASASQANILIASFAPGRSVPELRQWLDAWRQRRGDHEGAVIGLLDPCAGLDCRLSEKHAHLRDVAHQAGLDYLTEMPSRIDDPLPASIESYSERAEQVSGVLDAILHRPTPPRTFGT